MIWWRAGYELVLLLLLLVIVCDVGYLYLLLVVMCDIRYYYLLLLLILIQRRYSISLIPCGKMRMDWWLFVTNGIQNPPIKTI